MFLGAALATSAGAALLTTGGETGQARLEWCTRRSFPLAPKRITVVRGDLPKGATCRLRLLINGPEFHESRVVAEQRLVLAEERISWELELSHVHAHLVPGEYTYWVEAEVDERSLRSEPASYTLRPFRFGI